MIILEAGARWSEVSRLIYLFQVWLTCHLMVVCLVEIVNIGEGRCRSLRRKARFSFYAIYLEMYLRKSGG